MKKIIYLALALCTLGACNDSEFLKENADDFLTVDNSYLNAAQFRTGLNEFYRVVRQNYNFDMIRHISFNLGLERILCLDKIQIQNFLQIGGM